MMQLVELFTGAEQFSQELRIGEIFFPDYPTCLCTFPTVTGFLRIEKQLFLGGGAGLFVHSHAHCSSHTQRSDNKNYGMAEVECAC